MEALPLHNMMIYIDIYKNDWRSSLTEYIKLSAGQHKQKVNLDKRLGTILQKVEE